MNEDTDESPSEGFYAVELPCWKFSLWDVAGITVFTAAGVLGQISNGLGLLARECQAAANRARSLYDERQAQEYEAAQRAEAAEALRALVEGDGTVES